MRAIHIRLPLAAMALSAALSLAPGSTDAAAQAAPPAQPIAPQTPFYSDDKIRTYADAASEIRRISGKYEPRFRRAISQDERAALQRQAIAEMVSAVRARGLSVPEYNRMTSASQEQPELADQIARHMARGRQLRSDRSRSGPAR